MMNVDRSDECGWRRALDRSDECGWRGEFGWK
jgi:hypothetical protein